MRFLHIAGPGIMQDDGFCPYCHVQLEEREGYQVCPLCAYDTRRRAGRRSLRRQRQRWR
jgi:uncharacterized Zn finger protein (UPF0148 family)